MFDEKTIPLAELMFCAERFCLKVESAIADCAPEPENDKELALKIGLCRNLLVQLQHAYDEDELKIENMSVRADFRTLVLTLLWVGFRARRAIDYRMFRMLVLVQAGFNDLLMNQRVTRGDK